VLGGFLSLGLLKGIPGVLRELGHDPQPLLAEAGLSEKLIEGENNRVSLRALGTLLRVSAVEARCPHFGLLAGSRLSLPHLGALASALKSCGNLGAALRLLETRLGWDRGAVFRLDQDDDATVLTFLPYDPDADGLGMVAEAAIVAITAVLRDLFGAAWEPSEVYLPRRVPEDCRPYSAFFRAPVRWNQEVAGLSIATRDLNRLNQKADVTAKATMDKLPAPERSALIARRVRHAGGDETLLALLHQHALLQIIAVIDGTFAMEHKSDGLNSLVMMRLGDRPGRHRQDVHADLLRTNRFGGRARAIGETLLADISLTWLDHRDAIVC
jgi:hypothetical protein